MRDVADSSSHPSIAIPLGESTEGIGSAPYAMPRHRLGFLALAVRGLAFALLAPAAMILVMRWVPPLTSSFMLQRQVGALLSAEDPWIHYRWVGWREIPTSMKLAAIAAEDQKFPSHWGFDLESIADAAQANELRRRPRGASTITQQVAKNLFLWPHPSWVRKGLEAYLTVWIEVLWPKRRILEVYLNVAEMGDGIYGVGAASEEMFDRRPSRLTSRQSALLAAVLPNPRRFRAERPSPYVARRADWIQRQMWQLGKDCVAALEQGGRAKSPGRKSRS